VADGGSGDRPQIDGLGFLIAAITFDTDIPQLERVFFHLIENGPGEVLALYQGVEGVRLLDRYQYLLTSGRVSLFGRVLGIAGEFGITVSYSSCSGVVRVVNARHGRDGVLPLVRRVPGPFPG